MALASVVCLLSSQVLADVLLPIAPLELRPGDPLSHPIAWQKRRGKRVQIQLGAAPDTVKLLVSNSGKILVSWNPTPSAPAEFSIEIVASDVDTGAVLDSEELLVRFVNKAEMLLPKEAVYREQTDKTSSIPILPLIANQVISAGRVVSLRIKSYIPNGSPVDLHVDRLPRNASFDANPDGSRTFYWQTGDREQGEHVFRFTAINPNATDQRVAQDVLIIVGDPSATRTVPASGQSANE